MRKRRAVGRTGGLREKARNQDNGSKQIPGSLFFVVVVLDQATVFAIIAEIKVNEKSDESRDHDNHDCIQAEFKVLVCRFKL